LDFYVPLGFYFLIAIMYFAVEMIGWNLAPFIDFKSIQMIWNDFKSIQMIYILFGLSNIIQIVD